ncbi:MAG: rhodanese-like domain-containing protein [Actinomycetota bacterium]|nr:rhodanese-like domain-containing protein [Actinomycetota bacterium]
MTTTITPTEFAALGDDAVLIDVREPDELAKVRIPVALSMPMSTLGDHLDELPEGRFYLVCHSGVRSGRIAKSLIEQGHDAVSVEGGIVQWEQEDLPVLH